MNKKTKLYHCPAYLFCNYELLELSTYKIAEECGAVHSTILKWLKKFNIKRRTRSEAIKGKKNPMYGRTGDKHPMYGRTGKDAPMYGRTGDKHPMYGMTGEKSPHWKGYDVKNLSVNRIHKRINKIKPVDGKCKYCHQVADLKGRTKLELSNIKDHQYTLNPDDYQWAHKSCHKSYDWTPERKKEQSEKARKQWTPERKKEQSEMMKKNPPMKNPKVVKKWKKTMGKNRANKSIKAINPEVINSRQLIYWLK